MSEAARTDSASNAHEYTVSEISGALKRTVEDRFGHVRVRGEISGYRGPHSSGHAYFCMKDERARLDAVVWKTTMAKLKFRPEEGLEVIATGKLTTYPGKSNYQIVIDSIEPAGAGALMALLEERKRRLGAEGLFDPAAKQLLPFMPRVIGVVTSPTGAVIRDIIHRIADRFPLHILVWPVRVQGETSGAEVAAAVAGFNALPHDGTIPRPDVLIVARGGGSLEDLWGFNDEALVRAVATSDIPVISAVGHETDWTLVDLAADLRAPTPTGAAELAVPVLADLLATVAGHSARLRGGVTRSTERKRQDLRGLARALPSADALLALPRRRFDEAASRLERALDQMAKRKRLRFESVRLQPATLTRRIETASTRLRGASMRLPNAETRLLRERRREILAVAARLTLTPVTSRMAAARKNLVRDATRLDRAVANRLTLKRNRWTQALRLFETLNYKSVLARGFALVRDAEDRPVRAAVDVASGQSLSIEFADGRVTAVAGEAGVAAIPSVARQHAAKKPSRQDERQGSLL